MDQQKHCGISARAAARWVELRLASGNFDLRAGILSVEPVVLPAHAGTRAGLPKKKPCELVSQVLHGVGERASVARRLLLAARGHAGGITRDRTMVPEDHGLFRPTACRLEGACR